jgi:hypothetical protein
MRRFALSIGVLLGFLAIFVGDAHKILPAGVLWVLNTPPDWTAAVVMVVAVVLLITSDLQNPGIAKVAVGIAGLAVGVLAWLFLTDMTETPMMTLITAGPFLILTIIKLLKVLSPRRSPDTARGFVPTTIS